MPHRETVHRLPGTYDGAPLTDETARLATIADYELLEPDAEAEFNHIVELAASLFEVPVSLISIVQHDRQIFKAKTGVDICSTSREVSFCRHALAQCEPLIVENALLDARFLHNPLVLGPPFIRFYAGAPLITATGYALGTLCIIDSVPRRLSVEQIAQLKIIARIVMDGLERRRIGQKLRSSQQRLETMTNTAAGALVCADGAGRITFFNQAAELMFRFRESEVLGKDFSTLLAEAMRPRYAGQVLRMRNVNKPTSIGNLLEIDALRSDGKTFPVKLGLSTWQDADGFNTSAVMIDISERRIAEARLRNLAHIDQVSGMPNRVHFLELAGEALCRAPVAALLLLDLDAFKDINDTLGHSAGDKVLKEVARRLKAHVGSEYLWGRLGSDEFVLLVSGAADRDALAALGDTIKRRLAEPMIVDGQSLHLNASIGVALAPEDGMQIESLVASADLALFCAKARGGDSLHFFNQELRKGAEARRIMQAELRRAFAADEFELFWQPQLHLASGEIAGAEVLLRWRHPCRGLRTPDYFLPVLDKMLIASDVGDWVLKTALAQLSAWDKAGLPKLRVGVNLFEAQFRSGTLVATVRSELAANGIEPARLELEVTETIAVKNQPLAIGELSVLNQAGIGIAFDDFGTGYASLSMLKRFPLTRLKIDRSFVRDMASDREDAAIVETIIKLGRTFGLGVIAEGIETREQQAHLRGLGCREGQGYLYSKPVPVAEFEALLRTSATGPRRGTVRRRTIPAPAREARLKAEQH